jgi:hypothetical protein
LLLTRYSNIEYVLNLYWVDGINLINKAVEKTIEQKDWDLYSSVYPNMDAKTFITFKDFVKKKQVAQPKKDISTDEILQKAEEIRKLHQGTHEGVRKEE